MKIDEIIICNKITHHTEEVDKTLRKCRFSQIGKGVRSDLGLDILQDNLSVIEK